MTSFMLHVPASAQPSAYMITVQVDAVVAPPPPVYQEQSAVATGVQKLEHSYARTAPQQQVASGTQVRVDAVVAPPPPVYPEQTAVATGVQKLYGSTPPQQQVASGTQPQIEATEQRSYAEVSKETWITGTFDNRLTNYGNIGFQSTNGNLFILEEKTDPEFYFGRTARVAREGVFITKVSLLEPAFYDQDVTATPQNRLKIQKFHPGIKVFNLHWVQQCVDVLITKQVIEACIPKITAFDGISTWEFLANEKIFEADIVPNVPNMFGSLGYQYRVSKLKLKSIHC